MPTRESLFIAVLAVTGMAVFSHQARADQVLLAAPSAGGSYFGMYCDSCVGASFTLAGTYDVTTIDVVLRTPAATSFTTFDFSLQTSATTTIDSQALTATLGSVSTEVMTVNKILPPGTYYLIGNVPGYLGTPVTPGDVDGWLVSTGVYNNAAGTVANGVGSFVGSTFVLDSSHPAPAFTVNGSPVPEPRLTLFLAAMVLLLIWFKRGHRFPA